MRIDRPKPSQELRKRYKAELSELLAQPGLREQRPCAGCDLPCPCSGSLHCGCACSFDCPDARRFMSSDPDRHPIEPGIVPLVFALLLLRLCHPCWSCEGHADAAGAVTRLPQVWFAADSVTYPRLILACLHTLHFRKRIENPWRVGLSIVESDNPQPLFFIAPDTPLEAAPPLDSLRRDIQVIAGDLAEAVLTQARVGLASA